MEEDMLKTSLVAVAAATALTTGLAFAQNNNAPAAQPQMSGSSGQFMTQMQPNLMRGSKLIGVDVYGTDNQKIGDIDEVLVDRDGKIQAVVIGVGGFLGIGTKDVAFPFPELQWMNNDQARTAANTTNNAGGVTAPATPTAPATTGSTASTTGSTAATGTAGAAAATNADDDGVPDRAMVRMTKADLQNAPEFHYRNAARTGAAGTNTNPPANANRPATAQ
jgi:sporulation protein YlmC with PRC-barrel domain